MTSNGLVGFHINQEGKTVDFFAVTFSQYFTSGAIILGY